MIIPGKARFLKEFFDVGLAVTNLADAPFTFENGNATLQLPDGLSLAPTAQEQSLSVACPTYLVGRTARRSRTHWIIRGDKAGLYTIQTIYTGTLAPFDEPVMFTAQNANPIKVWGTNALQIIADVDDQAFRTYPYRVRIGLKNVTDSDPANATDVYNPSVELLTEGTQNFVYSPKQQLEFGTREDPAWRDVVHAVLRARVTGHRHPRPERLLHKRTAGAEKNAPEDQVISHPAIQTPATSPAIQLSGETLSWEAVPGADSYEVFRVPAGTGSDTFPTQHYGSVPIDIHHRDVCDDPWRWRRLLVRGQHGHERSQRAVPPHRRGRSPRAAVPLRWWARSSATRACPASQNSATISLASGTYSVTDSTGVSRRRRLLGGHREPSDLLGKRRHLRAGEQRRPGRHDRRPGGDAGRDQRRGRQRHADRWLRGRHDQRRPGQRPAHRRSPARTL